MISAFTRVLILFTGPIVPEIRPFTNAVAGPDNT